ncbi:hypothetical protein BJ322DRAFT_1105721 [Thelephora terrestris]|uniref:Uncharacterized protein n=1 Tax=Thelephora terrestris TaxID=56493 RepID=A0A9P6LAH2_9AGAM|nr:hypothetical protein BJ322DRAFT_1105721 [Thelephora terrestris]
MSLNTAATPFVSASPYEAATPYDVDSHLYDTPANIAFDNKVSIDFFTQHQAPPHFWDQAGYEDPNRTIMNNGHAPLLDAMEQEREERIAKLEKRLDLMHVMFGSLDEDFSHFALEHWGPFQASLYDTSVMTAEESGAATCHSPLPLSLQHRQDRGIPLPQSPPWNPAPVLQMVERTAKKSCKSLMTRTGQWCCPSSKARQVRMWLKLEVASLQDKYGFDLVSEGLGQVRKDMFDGLEHDVLMSWKTSVLENRLSRRDK